MPCHKLQYCPPQSSKVTHYINYFVKYDNCEDQLAQMCRSNCASSNLNPWSYLMGVICPGNIIIIILHLCNDP